MKQIRIVIVDDHALVRDAVRRLLEREEDIDIVGEASDGDAAVALICDAKPDVVVMDIAMKGTTGIEATRRVSLCSPDTRVLAVSMHTGREFISEMFKAGARGYLVKDNALDDVLRAVRVVASGGVFLGETVTDVLVDDYVRQLSGDAPSSGSNGPLTSREVDVLRLIAEGRTTKEIAASLRLSVKTVETHRRQIMEKTGIFSVVGLAKYALKVGLATLDD